MTWTAPPAPGPVDGPLTGDDRPILAGYLAWQRATLLAICADLTGEQLASRPVPPSNLSLLGLVRHLARVERVWFRERAAGQVFAPMYSGTESADFDDVDPAGAPADLARFVEECRLSDEVAGDLPPDHTFDHRGEPHSLGLVYVHMVAEYARHNGHADLLRERIDGRTGQ